MIGLFANRELWFAPDALGISPPGPATQLKRAPQARFLVKALPPHWAVGEVV